VANQLVMVLFVVCCQTCYKVHNTTECACRQIRVQRDFSGVLAFQFPYAFSDATVFDLDCRCRRLQRGDLVLMLTIACQSAVTRGRRTDSRQVNTS